MKNPAPYLIRSFLHHLDIRIDTLRIDAVYSGHPFPHSIRSLSDTLDELQVENAVYQLEFEQLREIDGAFVVVAGSDEYPFYIVEKLDWDAQMVHLRTGIGRRVPLTFDQFRSVWSSTVLMAEKGEQTHEDSLPIYWIKQGLWQLERWANWWIAGLVASLLICTVLQSPTVADWRYLIKAAGVAVSLLTVVKAFFDPHLVQRFCRQGQHSDCNEVFRSAGAKLFGWVSLGELSLTYFTASLIWGVFFAANPAAMFPVWDGLALLFVVYSLVWQINNRKWCPLCLAIDGVLVADFVAETLFWGGFGTIHWPDIIGFGLLFGLSLLAIRQIVSMAEENRLIPHLTFKREQLLSSPELFWQQLYKQPEAAVNSNDIHAVCNYVEAEHTITVVMNPSCPKCAKAHEALGALNDYRINLVFVVNEGDERSRHAALMIISSGVRYEWNVTDRMIREWYEKRILPEVFNIHRCAAEDLEQQRNYCLKNNITGTPTILVDNRRLPEMYDIDDLKVLL